MKKRHDTDTAISDIGGIVGPRDPALYRVGNVAHEVEDGQGLTGCGKTGFYPRKQACRGSQTLQQTERLFLRALGIR